MIGGKLFVKFLIIRGTWSERINMLSMLRFISPSLPMWTSCMCTVIRTQRQSYTFSPCWPCRTFVDALPLRCEQVPVFTKRWRAFLVPCVEIPVVCFEEGFVAAARIHLCRMGA